MILDPILARLLVCWRQLHGPTGRTHRAAILAATDRHLDAWNACPPRPDDPRACPARGGVVTLETLVPCPTCHLMGHHPFTTYLFVPRTIPGLDGPVAVPMFGDPPEGTPVIDRTCMFCGHRWTRGGEAS